MSIIKKGKVLILCLISAFLCLLISVTIFFLHEKNTTEDVKAKMGEPVPGLLGSGIESDPYLISNAHEFYLWWTQPGASLRSALGHVKLIDDFTITYRTWQSLPQHEMWGFTFDGNFHRIHLDINVDVPYNAGSQPIALFPHADNFTIKNLYVTGDIIVSGYSYAVAPLVGNVVAYATIDNCMTDVEIKYEVADLSDNRRYYIGGIVGCVGQGSKDYGWPKLVIKNSCCVGDITLPNYKSTVTRMVKHYYGDLYFNANQGMEVELDNNYYYYNKTRGTDSAGMVTTIQNGAEGKFLDFDTAYKEYLKSQEQEEENANFFVSGNWGYERGYRNAPTLKFLLNRDNIYVKTISARVIYYDGVDMVDGDDIFLQYITDPVYYYVDDYAITENNKSRFDVELTSFGLKTIQKCRISLPTGYGIYLTTSRFEVYIHKFIVVRPWRPILNGQEVDSSIATISGIYGYNIGAFEIAITTRELPNNEYSLTLTILGAFDNPNRLEETYTLKILDSKYYLAGWYLDTTDINSVNKLTTHYSVSRLPANECLKDGNLVLYPIIKLKEYGIEVK